MSVDLASLIVDVPDFPKPGISFFDITPLLAQDLTEVTSLVTIEAP